MRDRREFGRGLMRQNLHVATLRDGACGVSSFSNVFFRGLGDYSQRVYAVPATPSRMCHLLHIDI